MAVRNPFYPAASADWDTEPGWMARAVAANRPPIVPLPGGVAGPSLPMDNNPGWLERAIAARERGQSAPWYWGLMSGQAGRQARDNRVSGSVRGLMDYDQLQASADVLEDPEGVGYITAETRAQIAAERERMLRDLATFHPQSSAGSEAEAIARGYRDAPTVTPEQAALLRKVQAEQALTSAMDYTQGGWHGDQNTGIRSAIPGQPSSETGSPYFVDTKQRKSRELGQKTGPLVSGSMLKNIPGTNLRISDSEIRDLAALDRVAREGMLAGAAPIPEFNAAGERITDSDRAMLYRLKQIGSLEDSATVDDMAKYQAANRETKPYLDRAGHAGDVARAHQTARANQMESLRQIAEMRDPRLAQIRGELAWRDRQAQLESDRLAFDRRQQRVGNRLEGRRLDQADAALRQQAEDARAERELRERLEREKNRSSENQERIRQGVDPVPLDASTQGAGTSPDSYPIQQARKAATPLGQARVDEANAKIDSTLEANRGVIKPRPDRIDWIDRALGFVSRADQLPTLYRISEKYGRDLVLAWCRQNPNAALAQKFWSENMSGPIRSISQEPSVWPEDYPGPYGAGVGI